MLNLFSDLKTLVKFGTISIDNFVFKLHYKLSVIILLSFSILVNTRQFFGDPIDCTQGSTPEIANIIDTYCWIHSYNLVDKNGNVFLQAQRESPDGLNNYHHDKNNERVYQSFYQWIGIVLLLQAGLFYIPRFLWKVLWEEGRIKELVTGLTTHIQEQDEYSKRQAAVTEYVQNNKGHHQTYAFKFFTCEVINFFNVILQIFITDWFLGHAFMNYGIEWLWADENKIHPSYRYFPKEAHCEVKWGSSGGREPNRYEALCVLGIHVFNEKIYLFLWFYFIALAVISGLQLVYRAVIVLSPQVRLYMLSRRSWAVDPKILKSVVNSMDVGDWFIIYQMRKNMDVYVFGKLIKAVYADMKRDDLSLIRSHGKVKDAYDSPSNYNIEDKQNHFNSSDQILP